jgi:hypothetical protein
MIRRVGLLVCCLAIGAVAGCGQSTAISDAEASRVRARFSLEEEPADAVSVLEARELATGETGQSEIVLFGKIPASPTPWTKGRALFLVADPSLAVAGGDDPAHACGDGCPFCAKKQEDQTEALAVVEFVDDAGKVLSHDARQLFGVEENQIVVVRGKPRVDELGSLIISARGLYIRR